MTTAEIIKTARERANMTQEDLAEKLEVSRQAVSKWEMGLSVPDPAHLRALSNLLGVEVPSGEGERLPPPGTRWRPAALILGVLLALALAALAVLLTRQDPARPAPPPMEPAITDISFYDAAGAPFDPSDGAGWYIFDPGSRVFLVVSFSNSADSAVNAASLFLTPTGTGTFNERTQLAVQATEDRPYALFAWDIPEFMMGHLEVRLECSGGQSVVEELNVGTKLEDR